MSEAFDGTLDLTGSDPDQIGFPAVPSGRYEAHVGKAEWKSTENIDGSKALPHGTPYLSLGIRINDDVDDVDGQKVAGVYAGWTNLFVPPADYDATKAQSMKNRMANFLNAIGEDWQKKGYKMPSTDELVGRELTVIVRKKYDRQRDEQVNEIEGFKPAGSSATADSGLLV
jgi:hypothetical protein